MESLTIKLNGFLIKESDNQSPTLQKMFDFFRVEKACVSLVHEHFGLVEVIREK